MLLKNLENKSMLSGILPRKMGHWSLANMGYKRKPLDIFQNLFKAQENLTISKQLAIIKEYPRIFSEEAGLRIVDLVTIYELLATLKGFIVSKISGSDDWTVEFFLAFFDLLGNELLEVVEESRQKGRVVGALNATFLPLIPKRDKP